MCVCVCVCVCVYKKLRYRSQFWSDFHEIHMVGAGPLMGEPNCFWKQSAQQNHRYGGKCTPKTGFSGLSQTAWVFFWEKNWKTVFGTPFTKKKVILKNGDTPKNNFSLIFWKILFFSKKMLHKKYSKRRCLKKRLYWFLSPCAPPPPSKEPCAPTNGFFAFFSKSTAIILPKMARKFLSKREWKLVQISTVT